MAWKFSQPSCKIVNAGMSGQQHFDEALDKLADLDIAASWPKGAFCFGDFVAIIVDELPNDFDLHFEALGLPPSLNYVEFAEPILDTYANAVAVGTFVTDPHIASRTYKDFEGDVINEVLIINPCASPDSLANLVVKTTLPAEDELTLGDLPLRATIQRFRQR